MTSPTGTPSRPRRADAAAVERHHEAGRAEAALRAVALDQLALDRVRAPQAFDGPERLAVEHRQEEDAGIDRAPFDRIPRQLAEQYRAGAAIALGAAFLGAGAAERVAEMVEHGRGRIAGVGTRSPRRRGGSGSSRAPAAIQAPSLSRSARVMPVVLPIGIVSVSTARALIRADAAGHAHSCRAPGRAAARRRPGWSAARCGRPRNGWPISAGSGRR